MQAKVIWNLFVFLSVFSTASTVEDVWRNAKCDEYMIPDGCEKIMNFDYVEDYDRCGPAALPLYARNYYLAWAGRGISYRDNRDAFKKIKIIPQFMRDISENSLQISTLDQSIAYPIGIAPTALHKYANPDGEIATARAALAEKAVMIVSSFASLSMEEIAANVDLRSGNFWMQIYRFQDVRITERIARNAAKLGYKALVLTVDSNAVPPVWCSAKNDPVVLNTTHGNAPEGESGFYPGITTPDDIKWLKSLTPLPIVVKGILTGEDAKKAISAGASAIIVSNHGGRQLDGSPASIDALPGVVKAVKGIRRRGQPIDVYMDGGIRNGFDVYKALARGAKMVFVGRPILWGLALEGEKGARNVIDILRTEFNTTMLLAGYTNPSNIRRESVVPSGTNSGQICIGPTDIFP